VRRGKQHQLYKKIPLNGKIDAGNLKNELKEKPIIKQYVENQQMYSRVSFVEITCTALRYIA
jgi:hypothetical protein